jgi:hypothetical protein
VLLGVRKSVIRDQRKRRPARQHSSIELEGNQWNLQMEVSDENRVIYPELVSDEADFSVGVPLQAGG